MIKTKKRKVVVAKKPKVKKTTIKNLKVVKKNKTKRKVRTTKKVKNERLVLSDKSNVVHANLVKSAESEMYNLGLKPRLNGSYELEMIIRKFPDKKKIQFLKKLETSNPGSRIEYVGNMPVLVVKINKRK